jgi:hypothetical protein
MKYNSKIQINQAYLMIPRWMAEDRWMGKLTKGGLMSLDVQIIIKTTIKEVLMIKYQVLLVIKICKM